MTNQCPHCKSERTEEVVIKFIGGQEQRVNFCKDCKKIFRKEKEND